jgi:hypothetical protein
MRRWREPAAIAAEIDRVSVRFGSTRCGGSGGWCSDACPRLV